MSINLLKEEGENLSQLEDELLIEKIHSGNEEALNLLINKYRGLVKAKASGYFLKGGEQEDIIQEGMIGLYNAIRNYREGNNSLFRSFASLCITRQIITAVKMSTCQKHSFLNTYISLNQPFYEESEDTLMEVIPEQKQTDPLSILIRLEDLEDIKSQIVKVLSFLERCVLTLYLNGQTYLDMSEELNVSVKSIDNALQRIKVKLDRIMSQKRIINGLR